MDQMGEKLLRVLSTCVAFFGLMTTATVSIQYELDGEDSIETKILSDRKTREATLVKQNRPTGEVFRSLGEENAEPYLDAISLWFYATSRPRLEGDGELCQGLHGLRPSGF